MGIAKGNNNQLSFNVSKKTDNSLELKVELDGIDDKYINIPRPTNGYLSYQLTDKDNSLSGLLNIDLEMTNDGNMWLTATDASNEEIKHILTQGDTVMEKLSDVNPFVNFRLKLLSGVTGTINILIRI